MSQRYQFLPALFCLDDRDWMSARLLLLHKIAHVLWHVAFCHEEFTSLEVNCFFGRDVPHRSSTERLVILTFLDSCNVMANTPVVLDCFCRSPGIWRWTDCILPASCDNIHPWISTTGDLAFSHQQEFTVLNSQKGFRRSLPEISLFSLSSHLY